MALPILATPALTDAAAATLLGGPVAGSMPLSNLAKQQPSRDPTRFTDLSQVYWIWDLGAAYLIQYAATLYTNATSAATIRLRGATSVANLTASPGYDSGAVTLWSASTLAAEGYSRFPSYLYSAAGFGTFRYWRVDILDAANPAGYLQVGRAFLSSTDSRTLYTFPRGAAPGGTVGPRETVTRIETAAGNVFPTVNAKRDVEKFSVASVSEADVLRVLNAIQRTYGVSRALIYSRDPGKAAFVTEKTVYGLLTLDDRVYLGWSGPIAVNGAAPSTGGITYNIGGTIEEVP